MREISFKELYICHPDLVLRQVPGAQNSAGSVSKKSTDTMMWLWHTLTFLHCNYYTVEVSEALVSSLSLSPVAGSSESRTSSQSLAIDPMSQELITSREIFFRNKNQVTSSCGWWHPASHFSSTLDGPINYRLTWRHQSMTLVSRHVITRRAHSSRSQWVWRLERWCCQWVDCQTTTRRHRDCTCTATTSSITSTCDGHTNTHTPQTN